MRNLVMRNLVLGSCLFALVSLTVDGDILDDLLGDVASFLGGII